MGSTPRTGTLPAQMEEVLARLGAALDHATAQSNDLHGARHPADIGEWEQREWAKQVALLEEVAKVLPVQHDDQQGGAVSAPGTAPDPADDVFAVECSYCETLVDAANEPISCEECVVGDGGRFSNLLRAIDPKLAEEFDAGDVNVDDLAKRACAAVAALRSAPVKTGG